MVLCDLCERIMTHSSSIFQEHKLVCIVIKGTLPLMQQTVLKFPSATVSKTLYLCTEGTLCPMPCNTSHDSGGFLPPSQPWDTVFRQCLYCPLHSPGLLGTLLRAAKTSKGTKPPPRKDLQPWTCERLSRPLHGPYQPGALSSGAPTPLSLSWGSPACLLSIFT